MRTTLLSLAVAVLTGASVHAQTENKSAAASSTTLSEQERSRAVTYLEETRKEFLAAVDGLSEEQWKFKAAPERWSIAETAEHIAHTEDTIWQLVREKLMKSPPAADRRGETKAKDEIILNGVPDRSRKFEAPERLRPTGRWATREDLVKAFDAARSAEIALLKETNEDMRSRFEEHPFL